MRVARPAGATESNQALFEANPTQYVPKFGGFCAYGMSGADVDSHATVICDLALDTIDETVFRVDGGKLYLFKGQTALDMMDAGSGFGAYAAAAEANYAALTVAPAFVNSNSPDCQAQVLAEWRAIAAGTA